MKEFVIMMLGIGFIFILCVAATWYALSGLSNGDLTAEEVKILDFALVIFPPIAIGALGSAVVCIRLQRKFRRSQHSPK